MGGARPLPDDPKRIGHARQADTDRLRRQLFREHPYRSLRRDLERHSERRFKENALTIGAGFTFIPRIALKEFVNGLSGSDRLTLGRACLHPESGKFIQRCLQPLHLVHSSFSR
jgi:hypothetical protein